MEARIRGEYPERYNTGYEACYEESNGEIKIKGLR
jgi:hypothetical protein